MDNIKNIVCSWDDIYKNHDRFDDFLLLKKEIPELKVTFFVITYDDVEYFNSIKQNWIELVFHCDEHHGEWLHWSKEEAIEKLKYYKSIGFSNGFKAPGWKMTQNIADAINELDYWGCVCEGFEYDIKNKWVTIQQGLYETTDYIELYGHIQDTDFNKKFDSIREVYNSKQVSFKFVSEMINLHENI